MTRRRTAWTAIGARVEEYCETILGCYQRGKSQSPAQAPTFELSEVVAARRRAALSSKLIGTEISVRYSTAFAEAFKNDSATMVGWIPLLSIFSAPPSRLPANTTTEVVPSPASTSCAADRSTSYRKFAHSEISDKINIDFCWTDHFGSGVKCLDAP